MKMQRNSPLGSAGCQPAVFGSLPNALREVNSLNKAMGSRQAAANYRPAACAPREVQ